MKSITMPVFYNEIKKPTNQYNLIDIHDGLNTKWLQYAPSEVLQTGTTLNSTFLNTIRNDLTTINDNINDKYVKINLKTDSDWDLEYSLSEYTQFPQPPVVIDYSTGSHIWNYIQINLPKTFEKIFFSCSIGFETPRYGTNPTECDIKINDKQIQKKYVDGKIPNFNVRCLDINLVSDISPNSRTITLFNNLQTITPLFNVKVLEIGEV